MNIVVTMTSPTASWRTRPSADREKMAGTAAPLGGSKAKKSS
jgi:hypothetical protein